MMTVRTQRTGWPVLRTPRWMFAGAAVLVAGLALAAISIHPSNSQRATDLQGFVKDMNTDIESCAGGINDSVTAMRAIESGTSHDVTTAVHIANTAAANCLPGNNMQLEALIQYQVHESLASFHLQRTVNDLVTWSLLARYVETDMGKVSAATTPSARATATVRLHAAQAKLDTQRAKIDNAIATADKALSAHVAPPKLPS